MPEKAMFVSSTEYGRPVRANHVVADDQPPAAPFTNLLANLCEGCHRKFAVMLCRMS
jgi:hypothetical protein